MTAIAMKPTRPYDLVKEFVIALAVVALLTVGLAAVFSSPDEKAITLQDWAKRTPNDVVATATAELAGTSGSATYGPPYNSNAVGQTLGPLKLQQWAGVTTPVNSANDLVITPLSQLQGSPLLSLALATWRNAPADQQTKWATAYSDALGKAPDGNPAAVAPGSYGPVPVLTTAYLQQAQAGGLDGLLAVPGFYGGNSTKSLLLLADGTYLEDQARARNLGGDQWGMMNETGNYPGQPWLWLYTFWYQVPPFSTSDNADAQVWALMAILSLGLLLLPFIPGLRSLPKYLGVYRLIWRRHYRAHPLR
ncbi:MAG TPA: hypothetical protein VFK66_13300 [Oryzihumus sp.]|nr:hypothetical protein [Oryzihumus sp.]